MMAPSAAILYTQDADLARRLKAFLRSMAQMRHVSDVDRLDAVREQTSPALIIIDLRARESRQMVEDAQSTWPDDLVIALGNSRSDPLRDAEHSGIYAAEDIEIDRRGLQALVGRAFDHLKLLQENRDLREESAIVPARAQRLEPARERSTQPGSFSLLRFPRVLRRFENVDALLAAIVEGIAEASGVARVGLFCRIRQGERYRLRAGLRCLPETDEVEFSERDPLVRWFERNAHLISRANLVDADRSERAILRRALDGFGAEVIVPLYAQARIIGWIFFGHRMTGERFDSRDLENMMTLAEHVSTVLENALLQEETTMQKTLAETLLKAIPPGIVATDEEGLVRWFNPMAEQLLGVAAAKALHKPIETLGLPLAEAVRETLETNANVSHREWHNAKTKLSLAIDTRRLLDRQISLGAVAVLHDLTAEESLRQKQDVVNRAAFWGDLAASMSHEIRNPLVAIKTFAQLLPERFEDADFRKQFSEIVVQEIDRLDRIITQINDFAHPPELEMKPIHVRAPVEKALEIARSRFSVNGRISLQTSLPNDLPDVVGDEDALAEAIAHLLANAAEATAARDKPVISLTAKPLREGNRASSVVVTVRDNGKGIAPELKDKIFSPFCTTKARGMGLGLPIVKRTVFDHRGRVEVDSSEQGTQVSIVLPATPGS